MEQSAIEIASVKWRPFCLGLNMFIIVLTVIALGRSDRFIHIRKSS